ncbi:MAG: PHP domain-containing protein [Candidatus Bathyarchaeia archaeon]
MRGDRNPLLAICRRIVRKNTEDESSAYSLADLHCHTTFSDGLSSPEEMAYEASLRGLQFLAITDHLNQFEDISQVKFQKYLERCSKIKVEGLTIIPGLEVSSLDGDIVCLLPSFQIKPLGLRGGETAKRTIERIHELDGLALAAHPFIRRGVGAKILELDFDGVEIDIRTPKSYLKSLGLAVVGSSDAHTRLGVGSSYTLIELNSNDKGSVEEIIDIIRQKQCIARTSRNKAIIHAIEQSRWLLPDYTSKILLVKLRQLNM